MEWISDPQIWIALLALTALDIVFSLDSVITAVGMADRIGIMVAAVMIAVGVMLLLANAMNDLELISSLSA